MIICCNCQPIVNQSITWGEYLPLISPIVVIVLFIIDRILNYYLKRKDTDRNWYLKVLIEPSIPKIHQFYQDVKILFSESVDVLKRNKGTAHENYVSLKAKENGKFQEVKRVLESDVIFPIQMRYPPIGEALTEIVQNLEDIYTTSLDSEKQSEEETQNIFKQIAGNRAYLLNELYSPLKSKSYFSWKKSTKSH